ncbi:class I SAM-dependent DNA methyltransferase [Methylobacterium iners]|uniref:Ubiquinone biosynthesis O-methyltransferase, mitochondrial n=1 Tax=Methylobacterium iners TaxID=418707 RepID=A0ABQ4S243_9HYPH|nr:SAM-dependent methyltransferase [Methylobacterium iners]GJD95775.1 Ubiquinone biosynthesis O-methyltransferase, mitochondrial [Methylobacterium iners]
MTRRQATLPPDYFEGMYASDPDPWRFETSAYEREKYAATLASLPRESYRSALEIGCSIGVFTHALAPRCASLVAIDVAESALEAARRRCADQPQVRFARTAVPGAWPEGRFDLILISEVIYFLDQDDLAALARRIAEFLEPGGDLVLVHWLGETDYPLSGDAATEVLIAGTRGFLDVVHGAREAQYRLDVLRGR